MPCSERGAVIHDDLSEMAMVRSGGPSGTQLALRAYRTLIRGNSHVNGGIEIHRKHGHEQSNDWISDL